MGTVSSSAAARFAIVSCKFCCCLVEDEDEEEPGAPVFALFPLFTFELRAEDDPAVVPAVGPDPSGIILRCCWWCWELSSTLDMEASEFDSCMLYVPPPPPPY